MSDNEFENVQEQSPYEVVLPENPVTDEPLEVGTDQSTDDPVDIQEDVASPSEDESEPIEDSSYEKSLFDGINQMSDRLLSLEKLFKSKILHSAHEEKIVDQMHRELQKYKEDMYSQLVRPILLDMIEMRDSILRVTAAHLSKPDGEQRIPVKTFSMYASDVQEILEKNNIEIFKSDENSEFTPVRQRAIKKIATNDQNLHGKIAESLSDGYNYNNKPISAEKVSIYYFEQPQTPVENFEEEIQNG